MKISKIDKGMIGESRSSQRVRQPNNFFRKLHENKKKLDWEGARVPGAPRSATDKGIALTILMGLDVRVDLLQLLLLASDLVQPPQTLQLNLTEVHLVERMRDVLHPTMH